MAAITAILAAASLDLIGTANTKDLIKFVQGELKDDEVVLVTAKTFEASERYPTFKAMCTKPLTQEELDAKAKSDADDAAQKAADKEAGIESAGANKRTRASSGDLAGAYHLTKDLPACAEDHPKYPIWVAIAQNNTVEDAKAACPAVNPPRKTSGVYTFTSEFRYFIKTGYAAMGVEPAKEEVAAETAAPEAATA